MIEMMARFTLDLLNKVIRKAAENAEESGSSFKQYLEDEGIDIWKEIEELSDLINQIPEKNAEIKISMAEGVEEIIEFVESNMK